jgi:hypothetical protein
MGIKIKGLDEMRRKLETFQRRAQNLSGPVAFEDLFPPEFMRRYTDFTSIDDLVAASGYKVESTEDFEKIPQAEWDALIATKTRFKNWDAMQTKAGEEYIERRLNLENL